MTTVTERRIGRGEADLRLVTALFVGVNDPPEPNGVRRRPEVRQVALLEGVSQIVEGVDDHGL